MPLPEVPFTPSEDVRVLLNSLLDKLERRTVSTSAPAEERRPRAVRVLVEDIHPVGYFSQVDPEPRLVANQQLQHLEALGWLSLTWQPGERGHLLAGVAIPAGCEEHVFALLKRTPLADHRARLESLLLGERFRFPAQDWRGRAIQAVLAALRAGNAPAPFSLADPGFNQDVLTALSTLEKLEEETPYRVFSVYTFNDSKRFYDLQNAIVRLARMGQPEWKRFQPEEVLRELNLVANPGYLLLSGAWELLDARGEILSLDGFSPSVGISAIQAAHTQRVAVRAAQLICIENLTTFNEMARAAQSMPATQRPALLCLAGNPSPACRRLLSHLDPSLPLLTWADLDYGGFNILAQLRKQVGGHVQPYRMDIETLDHYAAFARPLTQSDRRNLERLTRHLDLRDMRPVIEHLLARGLKLEQEAVPARLTGYG